MNKQRNHGPNTAYSFINSVKYSVTFLDLRLYTCRSFESMQIGTLGMTADKDEASVRAVLHKFSL